MRTFLHGDVGQWFRNFRVDSIDSWGYFHHTLLGYCREKKYFD
jgi:hypothetical protein